MEDYCVQLDVYHGPLDLLLYLIKRDEIDIHDIPVSHLAVQYVQYCHTLKTLDINIAGEFLVMAATLMEIKSAMMAHELAAEDALDDGEPLPDEGDDSADPRFELVQQLLAYKRFKDAARDLDERRATFASRFARHPAAFTPEKAQDEAPPELDMEDVSVWDLVEAFNQMMEQVGGPPRIDLSYDDTPLELHATDILDRLKRDGAMSLQEMFRGRVLGQMIGLFLATLELLRQGKVKATQDTPQDAIGLEARPESEWISAEQLDAEPELSYDPENPDDFDWPDEQSYKRYTRRIERRKRGEKIEEDEQFAEDIAELEGEENQVIGEAAEADDLRAAVEPA